jgi:hypothetical protein
MHPVVCVWTLPWYIWFLRFYYYHWRDTSVGELLVPECIIHPVVCVWGTDMVYLISTFLLLSLCRYLCWWTFSLRVYHPPSSLCLDTAMVYLISMLLLLSLARYYCWWTFSPRVYHPPSSLCLDTDMVYLISMLLILSLADISVGELLVPGCIIRPVVCVNL